jgi:Protein of unknown function (DUF998)
MRGHRRTPHVLRAACGLVGPAVFTAAWLVNGQRQPHYPVADEHISGLAALDAEHPVSMITGFVALGTCSVVFATELWRLLADGRRRPGLGPVLLGLGGAAAIAAGFLRRDTFLLSPPGRDPAYQQSWHNDGHDLAAGVIYATSVLAPLLLARRFRHDPAWAPLVPAALASSGASVMLMVVFATDVDRSYNGIVQRIMVTVPQAFMAALAVRALRPPPAVATVPARPMH